MELHAEFVTVPSIDGTNTDITTEQTGESDDIPLGTDNAPGVIVSDLTDEEIAAVVISGNGQVETINNDQITDIAINGSNHTITIESNVGTLAVNSNNSNIQFSANVTVDICSVSGSDNTAELAENVTLDCAVAGPGNTGFE